MSLEENIAAKLLQKPARTIHGRTAAADDGQLGQQESLNDEQDQSRKKTVLSV
jgi:hypothetical protein